IPYNGEEVVLHWANKDQYYIKSSEDLKDYAFTIDEKDKKYRVRFHLTGMDAVTNNNKANRAFVYDDEGKIEATDDSLVIPVYFKLTEKKVSQKDVIAGLLAGIEKNIKKEWKTILWANDPAYTGKDKRTIIEKHLQNYTKKNTSDYFIHKNLKGFLNQELDFYVKNEVMYLDDVDNRPADYLESEIVKIKAIRQIAKDLIDFLSQFEDFQKKLWLKKKFVIETNYCITIDRIIAKCPELIDEIVKSKEQLAEWQRLFNVEEKKLTKKFLEDNQYLVLDTAFFSSEFKYKLLASMEDIDEETNGLLIHGENFQALNLLQERYKEQVKCVYIDPPYNAQSSEILYKNSYKHSSWLSLIQDRLIYSKSVLSKIFVNIIAIDEVENSKLSMMLLDIFNDCEDACISIVHNPTGQQGKNFSYTHEFAHFVYPENINCIGLENREDSMRESEPDIRPLRNVSSGINHLRTSAANCFYPIYIKDKKIIGFGDVCSDDFHPESINLIREDGIIEVYPIDPSNVESKWVFARDTVESIFDELTAVFDNKKQIWDIIRKKSKFRYKSLWEDKRYSANSWGSVVLNNILPGNPFLYPKSIFTVKDCIDAGLNNSKEAFVLDYFAGSGTTAHAIINLNREDNKVEPDSGKRKYILVEMGDYFDTVLKPRIQKVIYAETWRDGKPVNPDTGISHCFKYIRLENYEDTLNNLELEDRQPDLLGLADSVQEDYLLRYMLDVETSKSLINLDRFEDPFNATLKIYDRSTGELVTKVIDLPETFNYLLGLRVRELRYRDGFLTYEGDNPAGETVLIIWRNTKYKNNKELEKFVTDTLRINTADTEYRAIYINGDTTLNDPHKKIILTEDAFHKLMFDVREL
ncbi:MAG TPA: DNA methyltransferase, partial [Spirochaetota bacterium]|nr:DNA methyltransferase [Spirochaetota bacterium]